MQFRRPPPEVPDVNTLFQHKIVRDVEVLYFTTSRPYNGSPTQVEVDNLLNSSGVPFIYFYSVFDSPRGLNSYLIDSHEIFLRVHELIRPVVRQGTILVTRVIKNTNKSILAWHRGWVRRASGFAITNDEIFTPFVAELERLTTVWKTRKFEYGNAPPEFYFDFDGFLISRGLGDDFHTKHYITLASQLILSGLAHPNQRYKFAPTAFTLATKLPFNTLQERVEIQSRFNEVCVIVQEFHGPVEFVHGSATSLAEQERERFRNEDG
jgi:hypothetical protein